MAGNMSGLLYYIVKKKNYKTNKFKKNYDKFIYIGVILGPLLNLPQLLKILISKNATGVSAISWIGFSIISTLWLIYGIVHKDKHLIIMNSALAIIQITIGIFALVY